MSIVEKILPYERDLFLWLNSHHTPFWDTFMWIYSGKFVWIPLLLSCMFAFAYKIKWRESLLLILAAILVGVLCDQISASVIKPIFERFRPTHHPDFAEYVTIVNGYRGGRFGFVSAHAANGFGVATLAALLFRNRWFTLSIFLWALTTCYSRIYLGVHFVSDIVGGMIVGILSGLLVYYLYRAVRQKWLNLSNYEMTTPVMKPFKTKVVLAILYATVIGILVYSAFNPTF